MLLGQSSLEWLTPKAWENQALTASICCRDIFGSSRAFTPPVLKGAKQNSWWLPRQLMRTRSHRLSDSLWSVSSLLSLQTAVKPLGSYHLTFSYRKFAQVLPWMKKRTSSLYCLGNESIPVIKELGKQFFTPLYIELLLYLNTQSTFYYVSHSLKKQNLTFTHYKSTTAVRAARGSVSFPEHCSANWRSWGSNNQPPN